MSTTNAAADDDFVIDLVKDKPLNLTKASPKTSRFGIGLYWTQSQAAGEDFDLDVTAFGCFYPDGSDQPRLISNRYINFYHNLQTPCGGIVHTDDDTDGSFASDNAPNESIIIDTVKLDKRVQVIPIVLTLYQAAARHENLGMVENGFVTIFDADTNKPIAQIDVSNDYKTPQGQEPFTAIQVGAFAIEDNGDWNYTPFGIGQSGAGLEDFIRNYNPNAKIASA